MVFAVHVTTKNLIPAYLMDTKTGPRSQANCLLANNYATCRVRRADSVRYGNVQLSFCSATDSSRTPIAPDLSITIAISKWREHL